MQCHYCDRDADIAVEKDGVRVGVCEEHFREQIDRLEDQELLSEVDPTE
ncbi:MAG: DUF6757 family protein [Halococcoides sp.]